MAGRRTNLALFVLLAIAFVTGALAYAIGVEWGTIVVIAHGIVGFAIVLLAPWKSVIVKRGLMRAQRGHGASVLFSILIVTTLLFGVFHSTGLARSIGPLTAMQLHVGGALLALPMAVWHVVVRRVRTHRTDLSRRQLMRSAALLGGAGAVYAGVEGASILLSLPGAERRFTGSFERGSFDPDAMPVTQWLNDDVPSVDASDYRLRIVTADSTRELTLTEIERFDDRLRAVIDCTGGWYAEQDWEGVLLERLVGDAGGASLAVSSTTGYGRRFPIDDANRLLLATRVGGRPLSPGHGAPARIVAPGRRGFWWVKWVTSIEVSDVPWWRQWPFPLT